MQSIYLFIYLSVMSVKENSTDSFNAIPDINIYLFVYLFGVVWYNGMSTIVGYLMPNPYSFI